MTIIVDQIIQTNHPEVFAGSFSEMWASGPSSANDYSRSMATFIGNVFFQQSIAVHVFGTNSPLWSLSNEFYYYVLFPIFLFFFGYFQKSRTVLRIFLGMVGVSVLIFFPKGFASGFLVFCIGGLVSWLANINKVASYYIKAKVQIFIGGLIFFVALVYSKISISVPYLNHDVLLGIGFGIFLATLANSQPRLACIQKIAAFVADISFSLYLTHFPIVILIATTYYGEKQIQPDTLGLSQFFIALGVILLVAVLFWLLFEKNTEFLKHKIMNFLSIHGNVRQNR